MGRFKCLVVIGALTVAAGMVATGSAAAAKGGNNDAAKQCQKGGWKTPVSQTGEPFKNQGDCVNDGAHGLGAVYILTVTLADGSTVGRLELGDIRGVSITATSPGGRTIEFEVEQSETDSFSFNNFTTEANLFVALASSAQPDVPFARSTVPRGGGWEILLPNSGR
jgi:hypothetical protein